MSGQRAQAIRFAPPDISLAAASPATASPVLVGVAVGPRELVTLRALRWVYWRGGPFSFAQPVEKAVAQGGDMLLTLSGDFLADLLKSAEQSVTLRVIEADILDGVPLNAEDGELDRLPLKAFTDEDRPPRDGRDLVPLHRNPLGVVCTKGIGIRRVILAFIVIPVGGGIT